MTAPADRSSRAWGWVAHLRAGGITPWSEWLDPAPPGGRVVPGAQQLELLRRLNASDGGPVSAALAERVLTVSLPGRGLPDLRLTGDGEAAFGPRPVDPADLPAEEVLRPAALLIAEDLVAGLPDRPSTQHPQSRPRRLWPYRRYRLVGDPLLADPLRATLVAHRRPPRPGGEIVVVADDLGRMLGHAWIDACFRGGAAPWPEWLDGWRQRSRVPTRIDLPFQAQLWAQRRGAAHVHVVTDRARLAPLLGVRRLPPTPPQPGATAAELARRVGEAVGLLAPPERRVPLLREGLVSRLPAAVLDGLDEGGTPALPAAHRDWVATRARRMARRLARGDYAEVPTRADLRPRRGGTDSGAGQDAVLALALQLLREGPTSSRSGRTGEQR